MKIFYIGEKNSGHSLKVYGNSWSTHEGVYRSAMCWYGNEKDCIVLDTETNIAKRFVSEHDNNGNLKSITCLSDDYKDYQKDLFGEV